jgi:anti-sigma B factor antagonist
VTIQTRVVGSATVMELHGELTSNDGDPGLRLVVRSAVEGGARVIILNLRDIKDVDSFGVAVLASSHMSAVSRGGRLMISELSRKLKHIFAITRLDTVFEMYDTEADAIADCRATEYLSGTPRQARALP